MLELDIRQNNLENNMRFNSHQPSYQDMVGLEAIKSGIDTWLGDGPASHQEALARTDCDAWQPVMPEEFYAQVVDNTWTLTRSPRLRNLVSYHQMQMGIQNLIRRKARLVVKDYS